MIKLPRSPRFFGVVRPVGAGFPEWPHDPRQRTRVTISAGWEVRVPALEGGERGCAWHLQLWQPAAKLSVLTPYCLVHGCYEVLSVAAGWKVRVDTRADLVKLLRREHQGAFLAEDELSRLERRFRAPPLVHARPSSESS